MNKLLINIYLLVAIFTFQGCATLYSGSVDTIHIASVPQGAQVEINGKNVGQTPVSLDLKRSISKKQVTLTKEGYKTKSYKLNKRFHPLAILDILTIVGGLIDVWSGAITPYNDLYYETKLISTDNTDLKIDKKNFYNLTDNYYLITFKGDTIFCEPDIKHDEFGRIHYTPIDGKRNGISNDEVVTYKSTERGHWSLMGLNKIPHSNFIFEAHPYWPEKRPDKLIFMQLILKDSVNKLLSFHSPSGVDENGIMNTFGEGEMAYYVFNGNRFIATLGENNFFEQLRRYFPSYVDLIRYLENENSQYRNLPKYLYNYRKAQGDNFYILPNTETRVSD